MESEFGFIVNQWDELTDEQLFVQDYSEFVKFTEENESISNADKCLRNCSEVSRKRRRNSTSEESEILNSADIVDIILSWNVQDVYSNPSIGKLQKLTFNFYSREEYFNSIGEVCLVESRIPLLLTAAHAVV